LNSKYFKQIEVKLQSKKIRGIFTLLKKKFIEELIAEDIGRGDLFSRVTNSEDIEAFILAKSDGLFAGREYIDALLDNFKLKALWRVRDGSKF